MGYAFCLGFCCACKRSVTFNPKRVPSLRINGELQPLCYDCATRWKKLHPEFPFEIPEDAYEPIEESEL